MQRKIGVYVAFSAIIIAMAFLLISAFDSETMVYSITVKELKAKGPTAIDKGFRINGTVEPGTIEKAADHLSVSFIVKDSTESMLVRYEGILPDTFKANEATNTIEVVLEGKYREDGTFLARNIMTKCASKYDPVEQVRSYNATNS